MGKQESLARQGEVEGVKWSPSGEVVLSGTERELTPGQRRELLSQISDVIGIYADAISSIMRPHDPTTHTDPELQQQALVENEVVFEAIREKAATFQSLTQQLRVESKGNHDSNQRSLITTFLGMLRKALDTPNATDRDMKKAWEDLHKMCAESKNRKVLELKLLALFHLRPQKNELHISEDKRVESLKKLARYCRRFSMTAMLGETRNEELQAENYKKIALLIEGKSDQELKAKSAEIVSAAAQALRHLNYNHPGIPTMSDKQLLLFITEPNGTELSAK